MANFPQTIGNYRLEHELGRGATSQVWMGRHIYLHERAVAVKLLLSHDEESILRFSREAELTSSLRHLNIVQIYDHATPANSFPYTVMELVPGGSLRQRVERDGRLPLREAVAIFRQIGSALDSAHSRKIVHRDVSPGNILLDATASRAVLTDFGIARKPDQHHTSTDTIMGTPGFFSPEHARSATLVTALSDLFSLGVVLYYMLSGALPWEEQPQHPGYLFGPVLPLSYRGVELPTEIDRIMQTLLAVEPQKRFPSAGAAAEALDRAFTRAGIAIDDGPLQLESGTAIRAINTAPSYQSFGLVESDVEQALATDLMREPFDRSHKRAEELRDPLALAQLLDTWSRRGSRWEFRRPQLGRTVNLREIRSRNVYFYELRALLETRDDPKEIEEPDADAPEIPITKELGVWQVPLPPPAAFVDDEGRTEILPGSERVVACPRCEGSTFELCGECKGTRRVMVTRPVAGTDGEALALRSEPQAGGTAVADAPTTAMKQILVPCTACKGMGRLRCARCSGAGRLVQRKAFQWSRKASTASSRDDLPELDEERIRREVEVTTVYRERQLAGTRREWMAVPGLRLLLEGVQQQLQPNTKIAMAEVEIQMIPYTEVRLDLGHNEVLVEGEAGERRADGQVHLLQIYGFENRLQVGSYGYDGRQKLMLFWSLLATLAVAVLLIAVVVPLLW